MEETRALLPDGPAPKARPTYRRDALCFALGCATAAMVLVAFDLPSALSSDSARAPAALSADEKMKAGTASQIAALKAQISEKDNALSLSLMELDRVRAVAATGDAGSSGCWEWVCPTPAPSPYPSGGETSRRRRCHPGRRGLESRVSHVARIFCSPSPARSQGHRPSRPRARARSRPCRRPRTPRAGPRSRRPRRLPLRTRPSLPRWAPSARPAVPPSSRRP